jgi:hypothetical protein
MPEILDATGDTNFVDLHLYSRMYPFPEYVKQAAPIETLSPRELPSTAYADPRKRQFPCQTKAATWVSALFFLEKKAQIHPKNAAFIRAGLTQFARHHGIEADIKALTERYSELHKQSAADLPDSAFAIVWVDGSGGKDRRYPLCNAMEVKAAAEWFSEHRDHFIFGDRQRIAEKILEKAAQFGVGFSPELDDLLEKQAGRGVYDPGEAAALLRDRARLKNAHPEACDRLVKLAEAIEGNAMLAEDPNTTAHLAATIDQFDRTFGVKYSRLIPRPEDVLFKGSIKHAAAYTKVACGLLTGSIYDRNQFAKLSVDQVRDALGNNIARAVTSGLGIDPEKMADVAPTLPLPDAQRLDRIMASVGQLPLRSKAGAVGLKQNDREKLAAEYKFANALPEVNDLPSPTGVRGSRVIGSPV